MLELIDTHCHFDRFIENGTIDQVIADSIAAGVSRMIAVGTGPDDWGLYKDLSERFKGHVYYAVGMHPCYVERGFEAHLERLWDFMRLSSSKPVALGEIGLDYFHLPTDPAQVETVIKLQKEAFREQIKIHTEFDIPLIIHTRKSFDDTIAMMDAANVNWQKVVLHCFSEGPEQIKAIKERGARASFTGIITFKKAENVKSALIEQGIDTLMLETDAPYLSPEPYRSKENTPATVPIIAQAAAGLLNMPLAELAQRTTANAMRFFNL